MSLLDVLRPGRLPSLPSLPGIHPPGFPIDEATGLAGRRAFEADLARADEQLEAQACGGRRLLALALLAPVGLDRATRTSGRRWAEALLLRAATVLARVGDCDRDLTGYRIGAHTFALVFTGRRAEESFAVAEAIARRIERDAEPLTCPIGLATWDGEHTADAQSLEWAADAALDQALLLGVDEPAGRVVTAADQTSGLRWIASRPSSTRSAAR